MTFILTIRKTVLCAVFLSLLVSLNSCRKAIEVPPPVTGSNGQTVFKDDITASAVLTGIYTTMSSASLGTGSLNSMSLLPALSADEITLFSTATSVPYRAYYSNSLSVTNIPSNSFWIRLYPLIFIANSAIEGLNDNSASLTPAVKQQLLGEAKFMRAFCYFYLVNLYGDIPLATTTDYSINSRLARTPRADVWKQIIRDLLDAQDLLSSNYLASNVVTISSERLRPTKWAATAMLARAYLYTSDWANAEIQSSLILNNKAQFDTTVLGSVFLKNSKETIWGLQPVQSGQNTQEAKTFTLPTGGPNASTFPFYLNTALINAFETGDQRRSSWVGSVTVGLNTYNYPSKYKATNFPITSPATPPSEYTIILRLSEQYLIRAEARAQLDKIAEAAADLNTIRKRAGLPFTTANDKITMLTAILRERQIELFDEWGHRWLDIKRTGKVDAIMSAVSPAKGGSWNANWQWYPVPIAELLANPDLTQNAGY